LVELETGGYCVVTFGLVTHHATISFPEAADVSRMAASLCREIDIRKNEVQWAASDARVALENDSATVVTGRAR